MVQSFKYSHPSSAIATYDYTDAARKEGFLEFYALTTLDDGTTNYVLNTTVLETYSESTSTAVPDGTTTTGTHEFETAAFTQPLTIAESTAYFQVCFTGGVDGDADTMSISGTVLVSDGTTDTQLGTVTTGSFTSPRADTAYLLPISLTRTQVKKGETIILKVELTGTEVGTGTMSMSIYHDPTTNDHDTRIYLPFEIDL